MEKWQIDSQLMNTLSSVFQVVNKSPVLPQLLGHNINIYMYDWKRDVVTAVFAWLDLIFWSWL